MLKGKENPELLACAAKVLEKMILEHGIDSIRYVVPKNCGESLQALKVLGFSKPIEELECMGEQRVAFKYETDES